MNEHLDDIANRRDDEILRVITKYTKQGCIRWKRIMSVLFTKKADCYKGTYVNGDINITLRYVKYHDIRRRSILFITGNIENVCGKYVIKRYVYPLSKMYKLNDAIHDAYPELTVTMNDSFLAMFVKNFIPTK